MTNKQLPDCSCFIHLRDRPDEGYCLCKDENCECFKNRTVTKKRSGKGVKTEQLEEKIEKYLTKAGRLGIGYAIDWKKMSKTIVGWCREKDK